MADLAGGMLTDFNRKHKRDAGGKFSTVAAARGANVQVHRGAKKVAGTFRAKGYGDMGDKIERHPYLAAGLAAGGAVIGTRQVLKLYHTGALVFAKNTDDFTRVASHVKPQRTYDVADQQAAVAEMVGHFARRPQDFPVAMGQGIRMKVTGKTQLPRANMSRSKVEGTNVAGRMHVGGAWDMPIKDINEFMTVGARPYGPQALKMFKGKGRDETLRNVEKKIKGNKHESAFVMVGDDLVSGMNGHYVMTPYYIPKNVNLKGQKVTFTHNHPAITKDQARSFSPGDFNVLEQIIKGGASKDSTLRAVYGDGTVQEIVITDWGKFKRWNRIAQKAIIFRAMKEGVKVGQDTDLDELLKVQAMIQSAAKNGRGGFRIEEHAGFAKRIMSDTEIRRRKKLQGHISQTTGTLGLASLGAFAAAKVPGTKIANKTPKLRRVMNRIPTKKAETAALGLSTASGGIGGAGAYNFAAYTGAESRKRKQAMPVTKAWQPSASKFDSENSRRRRSVGYEVGAGAAAAGTGGAAVRNLHQGISLRGQAVERETRHLRRQASHSEPFPQVTRSGAKARRASAIKLKRGGKLAAVSAAGVATAAGIHHQRRKGGSWETYGKAGDWKAIHQREQTQRRQRKTMRAAGAGAVAGAGLVALGARKNPNLGRDVIHMGRRVAGHNQEMKSMGPSWGFGRKMRAKENVRVSTNATRILSRENPTAAAGAGLAAGSAAVGAGAKAGHTYQQRKINQRRRARHQRSNMSKSAFGVDHGEFSKASPFGAGTFSTGMKSSVINSLGRSKARGAKPLAAQAIGAGLGKVKATSGAHERALTGGVQRAGALRGRLQHRENYPGSKKLHGFPKGQLP